MSTLGKYTQSPSETLDYDIDYSDFFTGRKDAIQSLAVIALGMTVVRQSIIGSAVKITLSGGVDGSVYKILVRLLTTSSILKEDNFLVKVKAS